MFTSAHGSIDVDLLTQAVLYTVRNTISAQVGRLIIRARIDYGQQAGNHDCAMGVRVDVIEDNLDVPDEIKDIPFLPHASGHEESSDFGFSFIQQTTREHQGSLVFRSQHKFTLSRALLSKIQHHPLKETLHHASL